ncbi:platelet glycoprotein Ib alpha chain [Lepisosteus oculatus]
MTCALLLPLLLLLLPLCCQTQTHGCHSDKDADHKPRISCTGMGLTAVPQNLDLQTQVLVLTRNEFKILSWAAYTAFPALHELDLSENKIESLKLGKKGLGDGLGPAGVVLPALKKLRLNNNRIASLPPDAFQPVPSIMEIYLQSNLISQLSPTLFAKLPDLEVVELSNNKIQSLPADLMAQMTTMKLKTFAVQGNLITRLPDKFFANANGGGEIPYVFLSHNPWICGCQVLYLQWWLDDQSHNVYLRKSQNDIENLPDSVVCDSPSQYSQSSIIDLNKDQICPQGTETVTTTSEIITYPFTTSKMWGYLTTLTDRVPFTTEGPTLKPSSVSPNPATERRLATLLPTTTEFLSRSTTLAQTEVITTSAPRVHWTSLSTTERETIITTAQTTTSSPASSAAPTKLPTLFRVGTDPGTDGTSAGGTWKSLVTRPDTTSSIPMMSRSVGGWERASRDRAVWDGQKESAVRFFCFWFFVLNLVLCILFLLLCCALLWLICSYIRVHRRYWKLGWRSDSLQLVRYSLLPRDGQGGRVVGADEAGEEEEEGRRQGGPGSIRPERLALLGTGAATGAVVSGSQPGEAAVFRSVLFVLTGGQGEAERGRRELGKGIGEREAPQGAYLIHFGIDRRAEEKGARERERQRRRSIGLAGEEIVGAHAADPQQRGGEGECVIRGESWDVSRGRQWQGWEERRGVRIHVTWSGGGRRERSGRGGGGELEQEAGRREPGEEESEEGIRPGRGGRERRAETLWQGDREARPWVWEGGWDPRWRQGEETWHTEGVAVKIKRLKKERGAQGRDVPGEEEERGQERMWDSPGEEGRQPVKYSLFLREGAEEGPLLVLKKRGWGKDRQQEGRTGGDQEEGSERERAREREDQRVSWEVAKKEEEEEQERWVVVPIASETGGEESDNNMATASSAGVSVTLDLDV